MKKLLAALFLATLPFAGVGAPEEPKLFLFDAPAGSEPGKWTDVEGNPETIVKVEYALALDGQDLNTEGAAIIRRRIDPVNGWEQKLLDAGVSQETVTRLKEVEKVYQADLVKDFVDGLIPRTTYRLWARVADPAGNWSSWASSDPWIEPDIIPPKPPDRVSCEGCGK